MRIIVVPFTWLADLRFEYPVQGGHDLIRAQVGEIFPLQDLDIWTLGVVSFGIAVARE